MGRPSSVFNTVDFSNTYKPTSSSFIGPTQPKKSTGLAPKVIAEQKRLAEKYGIQTFDRSGNVTFDGTKSKYKSSSKKGPHGTKKQVYKEYQPVNLDQFAESAKNIQVPVTLKDVQSIVPQAEATIGLVSDFRQKNLDFVGPKDLSQSQIQQPASLETLVQKLDQSSYQPTGNQRIDKLQSQSRIADDNVYSLERKLSGIDDAMFSEASRIRSTLGNSNVNIENEAELLDLSNRYKALFAERGEVQLQLKSATGEQVRVDKLITDAEADELSKPNEENTVSGIIDYNPMEFQGQLNPVYTQPTSPEENAVAQGQSGTILDPNFSLMDISKDRATKSEFNQGIPTYEALQRGGDVDEISEINAGAQAMEADSQGLLDRPLTQDPTDATLGILKNAGGNLANFFGQPVIPTANAEEEQEQQYDDERPTQLDQLAESSQEPEYQEDSPVTFGDGYQEGQAEPQQEQPDGVSGLSVISSFAQQQQQQQQPQVADTQQGPMEQEAPQVPDPTSFFSNQGQGILRAFDKFRAGENVFDIGLTGEQRENGQPEKTVKLSQGSTSEFATKYNSGSELETPDAGFGNFNAASEIPAADLNQGLEDSLPFTGDQSTQELYLQAAQKLGEQGFLDGKQGTREWKPEYGYYTDPTTGKQKKNYAQSEGTVAQGFLAPSSLTPMQIDGVSSNGEPVFDSRGTEIPQRFFGPDNTPEGQVISEIYGRQANDRLENAKQSDYFWKLTRGEVSIGDALLNPRTTQSYFKDGIQIKGVPKERKEFIETYFGERGISLDEQIGSVKTGPVKFTKAQIDAARTLDPNNKALTKEIKKSFERFPGSFPKEYTERLVAGNTIGLEALSDDPALFRKTIDGKPLLADQKPTSAEIHEASFRKALLDIADTKGDIIREIDSTQAVALREYANLIRDTNKDGTGAHATYDTDGNILTESTYVPKIDVNDVDTFIVSYTNPDGKVSSIITSNSNLELQFRNILKGGSNPNTWYVAPFAPGTEGFETGQVVSNAEITAQNNLAIANNKVVEEDKETIKEALKTGYISFSESGSDNSDISPWLQQQSVVDSVYNNLKYEQTMIAAIKAAETPKVSTNQTGIVASPTGGYSVLGALTVLPLLAALPSLDFSGQKTIDYSEINKPIAPAVVPPVSVPAVEPTTQSVFGEGTSLPNALGFREPIKPKSLAELDGDVGAFIGQEVGVGTTGWLYNYAAMGKEVLFGPLDDPMQNLGNTPIVDTGGDRILDLGFQGMGNFQRKDGFIRGDLNDLKVPENKDLPDTPEFDTYKKSIGGQLGGDMAEVRNALLWTGEMISGAFNYATVKKGTNVGDGSTDPNDKGFLPAGTISNVLNALNGIDPFPDTALLGKRESIANTPGIKEFIDDVEYDTEFSTRVQKPLTTLIKDAERNPVYYGLSTLSEVASFAVPGVLEAKAVEYIGKGALTAAKVAALAAIGTGGGIGGGRVGFGITRNAAGKIILPGIKVNIATPFEFAVSRGRVPLGTVLTKAEETLLKLPDVTLSPEDLVKKELIIRSQDKYNFIDKNVYPETRRTIDDFLESESSTTRSMDRLQSDLDSQIYYGEMVSSPTAISKRLTAQLKEDAYQKSLITKETRDAELPIIGKDSIESQIENIHGPFLPEKQAEIVKFLENVKVVGDTEKVLMQSPERTLLYRDPLSSTTPAIYLADDVINEPTIMRVDGTFQSKSIPNSSAKSWTYIGDDGVRHTIRLENKKQAGRILSKDEIKTLQQRLSTDDAASIINANAYQQFFGLNPLENVGKGRQGVLPEGIVGGRYPFGETTGGVTAPTPFSAKMLSGEELFQLPSDSVATLPKAVQNKIIKSERIIADLEDELVVLGKESTTGIYINPRTKKTLRYTQKQRNAVNDRIKTLNKALVKEKEKVENAKIRTGTIEEELGGIGGGELNLPQFVGDNTLVGTPLFDTRPVQNFGRFDSLFEEFQSIQNKIAINKSRATVKIGGAVASGFTKKMKNATHKSLKLQLKKIKKQMDDLDKGKGKESDQVSDRLESTLPSIAETPASASRKLDDLIKISATEDVRIKPDENIDIGFTTGFESLDNLLDSAGMDSGIAQRRLPVREGGGKLPAQKRRDEVGNIIEVSDVGSEIELTERLIGIKQNLNYALAKTDNESLQQIATAKAFQELDDISSNLVFPTEIGPAKSAAQKIVKEPPVPGSVRDQFQSTMKAFETATTQLDRSSPYTKANEIIYQAVLGGPDKPITVQISNFQRTLFGRKGQSATRTFLTSAYEKEGVTSTTDMYIDTIRKTTGKLGKTTKEEVLTVVDQASGYESGLKAIANPQDLGSQSYITRHFGLGRAGPTFKEGDDIDGVPSSASIPFTLPDTPEGNPGLASMVLGKTLKLGSETKFLDSISTKLGITPEKIKRSQSWVTNTHAIASDLKNKSYITLKNPKGYIWQAGGKEITKANGDKVPLYVAEINLINKMLSKIGGKSHNTSGEIVLDLPLGVGKKAKGNVPKISATTKTFTGGSQGAKKGKGLVETTKDRVYSLGVYTDDDKPILKILGIKNINTNKNVKKNSGDAQELYNYLLKKKTEITEEKAYAVNLAEKQLRDELKNEIITLNGGNIFPGTAYNGSAELVTDIKALRQERSQFVLMNLIRRSGATTKDLTGDFMNTKKSLPGTDGKLVDDVSGITQKRMGEQLKEMQQNNLINTHPDDRNKWMITESGINKFNSNKQFNDANISASSLAAVYGKPLDAVVDTEVTGKIIATIDDRTIPTLLPDGALPRGYTTPPMTVNEKVNTFAQVVEVEKVLSKNIAQRIDNITEFSSNMKMYDRNQLMNGIQNAMFTGRLDANDMDRILRDIAVKNQKKGTHTVVGYKTDKVIDRYTEIENKLNQNLDLFAKISKDEPVASGTEISYVKQKVRGFKPKENQKWLSDKEIDAELKANMIYGNDDIDSITTGFNQNKVIGMTKLKETIIDQTTELNETLDNYLTTRQTEAFNSVTYDPEKLKRLVTKERVLANGVEAKNATIGSLQTIINDTKHNINLLSTRLAKDKTFDFDNASPQAYYTSMSTSGLDTGGLTPNILKNKMREIKRNAKTDGFDLIPVYSDGSIVWTVKPNVDRRVTPALEKKLHNNVVNAQNALNVEKSKGLAEGTSQMHKLKATLNGAIKLAKEKNVHIVKSQFAIGKNKGKVKWVLIPKSTTPKGKKIITKVNKPVGSTDASKESQFGIDMNESFSETLAESQSKVKLTQYQKELDDIVSQEKQLKSGNLSWEDMQTNAKIKKKEETIKTLSGIGRTDGLGRNNSGVTKKGFATSEQIQDSINKNKKLIKAYEDGELAKLEKLKAGLKKLESQPKSAGNRALIKSVKQEIREITHGEVVKPDGSISINTNIPYNEYKKVQLKTIKLEKLAIKTNPNIGKIRALQDDISKLKDDLPTKDDKKQKLESLDGYKKLLMQNIKEENKTLGIKEQAKTTAKKQKSKEEIYIEEMTQTQLKYSSMVPYANDQATAKIAVNSLDGVQDDIAEKINTVDQILTELNFDTKDAFPYKQTITVEDANAKYYKKLKKLGYYKRTEGGTSSIVSTKQLDLGKSIEMFTQKERDAYLNSVVKIKDKAKVKKIFDNITRNEQKGGSERTVSVKQMIDRNIDGFAIMPANGKAEQTMEEFGEFVQDVHLTSSPDTMPRRGPDGSGGYSIDRRSGEFAKDPNEVGRLASVTPDKKFTYDDYNARQRAIEGGADPSDDIFAVGSERLGSNPSDSEKYVTQILEQAKNNNSVRWRTEAYVQLTRYKNSLLNDKKDVIIAKRVQTDKLNTLTADLTQQEKLFNFNLQRVVIPFSERSEVALKSVYGNTPEITNALDLQNQLKIAQHEVRTDIEPNLVKLLDESEGDYTSVETNLPYLARTIIGATEKDEWMYKNIDRVTNSLSNKNPNTKSITYSNVVQLRLEPGDVPTQIYDATSIVSEALDTEWKTVLNAKIGETLKPLIEKDTRYSITWSKEGTLNIKSPKQFNTRFKAFKVSTLDDAQLGEGIDDVVKSLKEKLSDGPTINKKKIDKDGIETGYAYLSDDFITEFGTIDIPKWMDSKSGAATIKRKTTMVRIASDQLKDRSSNISRTRGEYKRKLAAIERITNEANKFDDDYLKDFVLGTPDSGNLNKGFEKEIQTKLDSQIVLLKGVETDLSKIKTERSTMRRNLVETTDDMEILSASKQDKTIVRTISVTKAKLPNSLMGNDSFLRKFHTGDSDIEGKDPLSDFPTVDIYEVKQTKKSAPEIARQKAEYYEPPELGFWAKVSQRPEIQRFIPNFNKGSGIYIAPKSDITKTTSNADLPSIFDTESAKGLGQTSDGIKAYQDALEKSDVPMSLPPQQSSILDRILNISTKRGVSSPGGFDGGLPGTTGVEKSISIPFRKMAAFFGRVDQDTIGPPATTRPSFIDRVSNVFNIPVVKSDNDRYVGFLNTLEPDEKKWIQSNISKGLNDDERAKNTFEFLGGKPVEEIVSATSSSGKYEKLLKELNLKSTDVDTYAPTISTAIKSSGKVTSIDRKYLIDLFGAKGEKLQEFKRLETTYGRGTPINSDLTDIQAKTIRDIKYYDDWQKQGTEIRPLNKIEKDIKKTQKELKAIEDKKNAKIARLDDEEMRVWGAAAKSNATPKRLQIIASEYRTRKWNAKSEYDTSRKTFTEQLNTLQTEQKYVEQLDGFKTRGATGIDERTEEALKLKQDKAKFTGIKNQFNDKIDEYNMVRGDIGNISDNVSGYFGAKKVVYIQKAGDDYMQRPGMTEWENKATGQTFTSEQMFKKNGKDPVKFLDEDGKTAIFKPGSDPVMGIQMVVLENNWKVSGALNEVRTNLRSQLNDVVNNKGEYSPSTISSRKNSEYITYGDKEKRSEIAFFRNKLSLSDEDLLNDYSLMLPMLKKKLDPIEYTQAEKVLAKKMGNVSGSSTKKTVTKKKDIPVEFNDAFNQYQKSEKLKIKAKDISAERVKIKDEISHIIGGFDSNRKFTKNRNLTSLSESEQAKYVKLVNKENALKKKHTLTELEQSQTSENAKMKLYEAQQDLAPEKPTTDESYFANLEKLTGKTRTKDGNIETDFGEVIGNFENWDPTGRTGKASVDSWDSLTGKVTLGSKTKKPTVRSDTPEEKNILDMYGTTKENPYGTVMENPQPKPKLSKKDILKQAFDEEFEGMTSMKNYARKETEAAKRKAAEEAKKKKKLIDKSLPYLLGGGVAASTTIPKAFSVYGEISTQYGGIQTPSPIQTPFTTPSPLQTGQTVNPVNIQNTLPSFNIDSLPKPQDFFINPTKEAQLPKLDITPKVKSKSILDQAQKMFTPQRAIQFPIQSPRLNIDIIPRQDIGAKLNTVLKPSTRTLPLIPIPVKTKPQQDFFSRARPIPFVAPPFWLASAKKKRKKPKKKKGKKKTIVWAVPDVWFGKYDPEEYKVIGKNAKTPKKFQTGNFGFDSEFA